MKVLVDTNVLIDVAQPRERAAFYADSRAILDWCARHPGQGFIAWHSLSNAYYLLRSPLGNQGTRDFIDLVLSIFEVAETGTASAKLAASLAMRDFEDALQMTAAIAVGADVIVTRNTRDFVTSLISVRTPTEFLASHRP